MVSTSTRVILVGGDERQARAVRALDLPPTIELEHICPRWTRNWNKPLATARRQARNADAIAITHDVPILLGKALKQLAREQGICWVSGPARGMGSLRRLILKAASLSRGENAA